MLLSWLACGPPPPAEIDFVTELTLYDTREVRPDAGVRDARGRILPDARTTLELGEGLASTPDGQGFACSRSGSSTITLVSEPVRHVVQVRCVLVDALEVHPSAIDGVLRRVGDSWESLELPPLQIDVRGSDGETIDVPVQVRSSKTEVLTIGPANELFLEAYGRATLSVEAGGQRVEVPVIVAREEAAAAQLRVPENGTVGYKLTPGSWRWSMLSDQPVVARVQGGDCGDAQSGRVGGGDCTLTGLGEIRIQNLAPGQRTVTLQVIRLPD
jgi:hypothetical protein